MSILSLEFLILMAALLAVHYCLPVRLRWCSLLAASLVFYAFAGWGGMVYLGGVTLLTWLAGLYMGCCRRREKEALAGADKAEAWRRELKRKRGLLWMVLLVIGGMVFFKYADLIYLGANTLYVLLTESRTPLTAMQLIVPLGLSYFTFQSVGYVVDCARGKVQPERNPLKYLLFVSFFPQITQGPITTCKQLMPQLLSPARFEPSAFVSGFQLALWGYFKKLVLADRLAPVTAGIAKAADQPGWLILLGVALYAIRLYADFSGGMDVIRGAAKMLGVEVTENFRRPFFSTSVAEYWRRWHISLGAWVYIIPSRCLSFPKMLVDTLHEQGITVLCMTPSSYVKAASSGAMTENCLPHLKYIILSGEAAHWQTLQVWLTSAPNAKVWNFYGSTELLGVAVKRLERTYSDSELIPVGRAYAGVEILIVDEDGNELPGGEKGEMLIANPWLFSGYYRDKARTDAAFADDPLNRGYRTRYYCTGDIGCISEDGMLTVHGRKDSQIKRAGYRMELGEVDVALRQIPGWVNGLALYDKESGQLCCFWEGVLTQKEILTALKKQLPRYALPDTYIHLEEMPYTATMKIDREKLRKML